MRIIKFLGVLLMVSGCNSTSETYSGGKAVNNVQINESYNLQLEQGWVAKQFPGAFGGLNYRITKGDTVIAISTVPSQIKIDSSAESFLNTMMKDDRPYSYSASEIGNPDIQMNSDYAVALKSYVSAPDKTFKVLPGKEHRVVTSGVIIAESIILNISIASQSATSPSYVSGIQLIKTCCTANNSDS